MKTFSSTKHSLLGRKSQAKYDNTCNVPHLLRVKLHCCKEVLFKLHCPMDRSQKRECRRRQLSEERKNLNTFKLRDWHFPTAIFPPPN